MAITFTDDDLKEVLPPKSGGIHFDDSDFSEFSKEAPKEEKPEGLAGKAWRLINTPVQQLVGGPEPLPPIDEIKRVAQSGTPLERKAMGVRLGADEFLGAMTSPLGLGTLGLAKLPTLARAASLAFGAQMAKSAAVDIPKAIGEEMGKPENKRDYTKLYKLWTAEALNVPTAATALAHGVMPSPKPAATIPDSVKAKARDIQAAAPILPKAAAEAARSVVTDVKQQQSEAKAETPVEKPAEQKTEQTVPEKPETLRAQTQMAGQPDNPRAVVFVPKGSEPPADVGNLKRIAADDGTIFFNPDKISETQIADARANGKFHELLGHIETKEQAHASGQPTVVTATSPEGTELNSSVVSKERAPEQAAELQKQNPGATVSEATPEQVIANRNAGGQATEAPTQVTEQRPASPAPSEQKFETPAVPKTEQEQFVSDLSELTGGTAKARKNPSGTVTIQYPSSAHHEIEFLLTEYGLDVHQHGYGPRGSGLLEMELKPSSRERPATPIPQRLEAAKGKLSAALQRDAAREAESREAQMRAEENRLREKASGKKVQATPKIDYETLTDAERQRLAVASAKPIASPVSKPPEVLPSTPPVIAKNAPTEPTDTPTKEVTETATETPAPISVIQKYRLKNTGPQLWTKVRDLPPQQGDLPDEKYVEVKNEKTGDVQTVEAKQLQPVKERTAEQKAKVSKTDLDAKLKARGYNPENLSTAEKKLLLKRPAKGPGIVGMGGAMENEFTPTSTAMEDLQDATQQLPEKASSPSKAFNIGESLGRAKEGFDDTILGLRAAGRYMLRKLEGRPEWTDLKAAIGDRHLSLSESAKNVEKFVADAKKRFPDKLTQEAISNWVDTGGDPEVLKRAADETRPRYKAGYEAAQKLTPEQVEYAKKIKGYFDRRLQEAIDAGILEDGVENYIHRMYEKDSPFKKAILAELRSGIFTGKPSLAKQRVNQYDFDAEKAGLKPEKSFIKRIAAYDLALNKAIADRAAVKAMTQIKMPDGRPMIDVGGIRNILKNDEGSTDATLIRPDVKRVDEENPQSNRGDYMSRDFPALRKWKWVSQDSEGKPIFVQGDVLVHPEATKSIDALMGRSRIRENPVGRFALGVSSAVKQTMLDLSGFHPVQITVHGFEHKNFGPIKEIDFNDPYQAGLVRGGMVVGETTGQHLFSEGLSGSSITKYIPVLGEKMQQYQHWLFNSYIPRLKMATGLHAFERNRAKYPDLSTDELFHLTANQMNAAFGELNYEMMGRSKTAQDAWRLSLLAPDFLEARSKFVAQGATKYGGEQRAALFRGALALYITARIINKLLDDQYHWEAKNAFNVVHNGKAYSLRTVQGDLIHLATEPMSFASHRLNPTTVRPMLEAITGRDDFGRKRNALQQGKDIAKTAVPISLRGLPFVGEKEQTLAESLMNAFGVTEHRDSPSADISKIARDWKEKNKIHGTPGEFIYDPDKDPYRKIRNAAIYYDAAAVKKEIDAAVAGGAKRKEILQYFIKSAKSTFTGSAKHEHQFKAQLSADDQQKYQQAVQERLKILHAVRSAMQ